MIPLFISSNCSFNPAFENDGAIMNTTWCNGMIKITYYSPIIFLTLYLLANDVAESHMLLFGWPNKAPADQKALGAEFIPDSV